MSGFCGWFGAASSPDQQAMLRRMAARLPDCGPSRVQEIGGAGFAVASRIHPAMGGCFEEGDIAAVVEGYPVWSEVTLARLSREAGPARTLIAAYRAKGASLFDLLRGPFSFALFDSTRKRGLLAIDRFGIQTLCYAQSGEGALVFGSTTDTVRSHGSVRSTIPVQSIFNFLYFIDRIPAPETIYRDHRKLVPGECILSEPGRNEVRRYWQMPYVPGEDVDPRAAAEALRGHLRSAVATTLAGEAPGRVGAFLSGGLDSSSVVGVAAEQLSGDLHTFTIGFPVAGFDETHYAELAATRFGTQHHVYTVQPQDVVEVLNKAAVIYDEPFANLSMVPAYVCARLAREAGMEMLLAGDGGDELFAGNERYSKDQIFDGFERLPNWLRTTLRRSAAAVPAPVAALSPAAKAVRFVERSAQSVPERMIGNVFLAVNPRDMFTADAFREVDTEATRALVTGIFDAPARGDKLQRMMHFDLRITLADSDLRKVNRMCELAGVRVRYPFLVDELAEFSAGLPRDLLMQSGKLRQFYKNSMAGFLPREILEKQKHGFGLPYMDFLKSYPPLQSLMCDGLASLRKRGYFRIDYLDGLIARVRSNTMLGPDAVVWDLLILEMWLDSRTWN